MRIQHMPFDGETLPWLYISNVGRWQWNTFTCHHGGHVP